LAKIVRGVAVGDIRRHLEAREAEVAALRAELDAERGGNGGSGNGGVGGGDPAAAAANAAANVEHLLAENAALRCDLDAARSMMAANESQQIQQHQLQQQQLHQQVKEFFSFFFDF
jgi:hypothetical protein